ncbi:MAG TPA: HAD family hydrolase [Polyangiaceae bacterium]|nr:HAD family hydrolase [Polyangiaceae bacterium]
MIRAVLWDVGGTLVNFAVSSDEWINAPLRACGIDPGLLDSEATKLAMRKLWIEEDTWRTTSEEAGRELAAYFSKYAPVPGIPDLLKELDSRGLRQGVVSNWPPSLRNFLKHHALDQHLRTIVCSNSSSDSLPLVNAADTLSTTRRRGACRVSLRRRRVRASRQRQGEAVFGAQGRGFG